MRRIGGLLILAILWQTGATLAGNVFFPPALNVLKAWWFLLIDGVLLSHVLTSFVHIVLGFLCAAIFGMMTATLIYQYKGADLVIMPVIDAMRPIAALTVFPLIILILGLGVKSKVFVIFWTAWPAVLLNTVHGMRSVDMQVIEAARLDGAGKWRLLFEIVGPLGLPTIMTGLRIGLSGGWISLVSAEMLGSSSGLGYAILAYSQTFRFAQMYAIVLTIAGMGLAMNVLMAIAQSNIERNGEHESPFLRFHDRASSFVLDRVRMPKGRRAPTGSVRQL